jgi:hypothetical protein
MLSSKADDLSPAGVPILSSYEPPAVFFDRDIGESQPLPDPMHWIAPGRL